MARATRATGRPAARSASVVGRRRKPGFLEPCHPDEADKPPTGGAWAHEIKWDGYRAQAHLDDGEVEIYTRAGNDWSQTFYPVSEAISKLPASSAILDGEVVALKEGVADFHELRRQLGDAHPAIVYQVFDLLWLDGEDLRPLPYRERKARLAALLAKRASRRLAYVEHLVTDGRRMLAGACRLQLEGIVSKLLDSPYGSGRTHSWVKTKCTVSETFAVVGYTADSGPVEGLLLARGREGSLTYAGTVEHGLSADNQAELRRRLEKLVVRRPELAKPPKKAAGKVRWVVPKVMVEVTYPNKGADGRLRHPRFKGIRDDLAR